MCDIYLYMYIKWQESVLSYSILNDCGGRNNRQEEGKEKGKGIHFSHFD